MKFKNIFLVFILLLILLNIALAQEPVFDKINEYNKEKSDFYLQNISFLVAFLAGILSLLLPCTIAILPAFFSYTFKEKSNLVKMTLTFFLGFALIFVLFGILASAVGQTILMFQSGHKFLIFLAGLLMIFFGLITFFGYGFSSLIRPNAKPRTDTIGIFIFGVLFAVGWSACLGPILAGILLMASTLHNYYTAALLLFFYSLGLFIPLFTLSFFFDKLKIQRLNILNKEINFLGFKLSIINIIAGLLLIIIGLVFIIYNGTSVFNSLTPFKSMLMWSYNIDKSLLEYPNKFILNMIGIVILALFIGFIVYILRKDRRIRKDI